MKKRILFVDDEPKVLEGLRRMLRPLRHEWDMAFAQSGKQALDTLVNQPFDVVVSDMRMPGMDGARLLTEVMQRYPHMVRIVLSGYSARELLLRTIGPTHQYLAKPCDPERLKNVVTRACTLRNLLADASLRQLASQMNTLPSLPQAYLEILDELQSPDASIRKIGEIISKDVGMTAKVLQLVNSAFFGLRRHVSDPSQAVKLLGLDTLQGLVLSVHVFSHFDRANANGFCLQTLWNHSAATGALAKRICAAENCEAELCDHALMAGLLHDAGKLVLAVNLPQRYSEALALARDQHLQQWTAERHVFGTTHAEVGAYLLGLWGLPDPIVEALAFHHCPNECPAAAFTPLAAVHVANALEHDADEVEGGRSARSAENPFSARRQGPRRDSRSSVNRLDTDYLTRIGLTERLSAWRELSEAVVQKGAGQ